MTKSEGNLKSGARRSESPIGKWQLASGNSFHSSFVFRPSSFLLLCCALSGHAAVDETKLPPPARMTVDFDRDIKPIFEHSCYRCHGPEKPKSRFRLDDRASALKGGENGVDIIPGQSAKSPLTSDNGWVKKINSGSKTDRN